MSAIPDTPLAERMRPVRFEDFVGQSHLVGPEGALSMLLRTRVLPSMIFWGPPGVGKTTLGRIIATEFEREFIMLNAISAGVKDVREVIERSERSFMGQRTKPIVFIDEIHRFNKTQQDSLLAAVEKGIFTLIGATTENPSFEVNSALLSRCQVFTLQSLGKEELMQVLHRAMEKDEWLRSKEITLQETDALLALSGGDARKLLNFLELAVGAGEVNGAVIVTNDLVQKAVQTVSPMYDKNGEMHYDIVSAFIKSMRGSDPHAAVYWMARMIEGGEDPRFIARRMVILASEDIGNANPNALLLATACFQAVEMIGFPEARIILSQAAIYLATSPKSNASYMAIGEAMSLIRQTGNLSVPLHLRNAPTKLMKDLDYGAGYKYDHDFPGGVSRQEFMPDDLRGRAIYHPGDNTREAEIRNYMKKIWGSKYDQ